MRLMFFGATAPEHRTQAMPNTTQQPTGAPSGAGG
jgi:hypothetical protein